MAGLVTTLLVVPCVYSLLVANKFEDDDEPLPGDAGHNPAVAVHPVIEDAGAADTHPL